MARRGPEDQHRRDPWLPAFSAGLLAVAASLGLLVFVMIRVATEGSDTGAGPAQALEPGQPTATAAPKGLTYAGNLPLALRNADLTVAGAGKQADVTFTPGDGPDAIVTRYFVPVAAVGSGVDALTRAQLDDLLAGRVTDWSGVGGVKGKVTVALAGPEQDAALEQGYIAEGMQQSRLYTTYDQLRDAMTMDSGLLALIPLEEVRVNTYAIAIDGVDLVRGRGDATEWPFTEKLHLQANTKKGQQGLPQLRTMLEAQPPKVTRVVATGDILQSRCSLTQIEATGDWGAALRGPVGDYLAAADLALGSLDGSIQDIGKPYGCVDTTNLTSPPQVMEALTLAGFDGMTVATNHIYDCGLATPCGSRAFLETLDLLHKAGIKTVGGGANLAEALAPAIFEVNGVKFGVLGFDDIAAEDLEATDTEPGTAPMDDSYADEKADLPHEPAFYKPASMLQTTQMEAAIKALKQQVDVVIVQIQSGYEDTHEVSPRSLKGLRAAADAGADLVVGNQGHWVQAAEIRNGTWISYALGNFIFDQTHTPEHTQGYLLEASFWGKHLANVRLVPYQIENKYKPQFVSGNLRTKILNDVFTASEGLSGER